MFEHYYKELLNFFSRRVSDRTIAADLAQETYARVYHYQGARQTPSFTAGKESAAARRVPFSGMCLLLLNVLANHRNWRAPAATGKVRRRPQRIAPEFLLDARIILLANHPARDALEAIDQGRHRHLGRIVHQQMHMVILAVELHQFCLKVSTDAGEDHAQVIENFFGEDAAAVFGHKDQMNVHSEYTVPAVANIVVAAHRPNYTMAMQRLAAYKYELRPDGQQTRQMARFAGSCRFVFNKALAMQKANHEAGGKYIGYVAMAKHLTVWRNGTETPWLKDAPVHPLQHALKDLERAYKNFFAKRAAFPRFKKKGQQGSFRYPDAKQIKLDSAGSRIFLPKLGWLRYRKSRDVLGRVCNATVSQSGGKWFVGIQTERDVEQPVPQATTAIGIDMGIARFATFSDGSYLAPLASFRQHEAALRKAQRCMSRKRKFSSNWKKAKARVQKIHSRIGNTRRDTLHKATTTISQNHAMVCIEDLQVRNMSKSAAGTADAPGRNVRAKSGLNQSILDQGWYEFRRQLEYKLQWSGGMLVAVPAQNTSRTCPECGCISKDNRQTQARFACMVCGYEENADVVGAINVLRAGHARLACGEDVSRAKPARARRAASVKQEPTEATQPSQVLV